MKIPIKGVIVPNDEKWVYELFGYEATSPDDVNKLIAKAEGGEELEVIINSYGGDVFSGSEMYTSLMDYKGPVATKTVGFAASAASLPAVAGSPAKISPPAQIMIHNVSGGAYGDYRVHEHESGVLKNYNKSIANAYMLKTGLNMDKLLELMDYGGSANNGTWLTAQQALEYGFVDEIMFDTENKLVAGVNNFMLPKSVIEKVRNIIASEGEVDIEQLTENISDNVNRSKMLEVGKARLNLLKLRRDVS